MSIKWETDFEKIITEDAILAVVETSGGTRFFVCAVDVNGTLCDLEDGDDYGWQIDCIDRWVLLSDLDSHLESLSDNLTHLVEEKKQPVNRPDPTNEHVFGAWEADGEGKSKRR